MLDMRHISGMACRDQTSTVSNSAIANKGINREFQPPLQLNQHLLALSLLKDELSGPSKSPSLVSKIFRQVMKPYFQNTAHIL